MDPAFTDREAADLLIFKKSNDLRIGQVIHAHIKQPKQPRQSQCQDHQIDDDPKYIAFFQIGYSLFPYTSGFSTPTKGRFL